MLKVAEEVRVNMYVQTTEERMKRETLMAEQMDLYLSVAEILAVILVNLSQMGLTR